MIVTNCALDLLYITIVRVCVRACSVGAELYRCAGHAASILGENYAWFAIDMLIVSLYSLDTLMNQDTTGQSIYVYIFVYMYPC